MRRIVRQALLAGVVMAPVAMVPMGGVAYAQTATRNYSIAPQDLGDALRQFARQSGRDVVFDPALTNGKSSKGVQGSYSAEAAIRTVLDGSGLVYTTTSAGFAIRGNVPSAVASAAAAGGDSAASYGEDAVPEGQEGTSEILVVGSRSQNVDIRRSENDAQPYVVFSANEIERSGVTSLEEFFRKRLTANAASSANSLRPPNARTVNSGNTSQIDLRGLGTNQTLILIDGRRAARTVSGTEFGQGIVLKKSDLKSS